MTGVFIRERRGKFGHRETDEIKRRPCEDADRNWRYPATNQKTPRATEVREGKKGPSKGAWLC